MLAISNFGHYYPPLARDVWERDRPALINRACGSGGRKMLRVGENECLVLDGPLHWSPYWASSLLSKRDQPITPRDAVGWSEYRLLTTMTPIKTCKHCVQLQTRWRNNNAESQ